MKEKNRHGLLSCIFMHIISVCFTDFLQTDTEIGEIASLSPLRNCECWHSCFILTQISNAVFPKTGNHGTATGYYGRLQEVTGNAECFLS